MKLLAIAALVLLAGCPRDAPATGPGNAGGGDPPVDEKYACTADTDCVAVELGCCDACNGGEAVGAHRDHVDAVEAERGHACTDHVCTELGCADWVPTCEAGTCAIHRGTLE